MDTKHTSGPWKLERLTGDHNVGVRVAGPVVSGYTAFINTRWPHAEQRIEQEANARLIAAAPELLEALRELLHECVLAGFDRKSGFGWPAALKGAEDAIAKATEVTL